ncbi:MAG: 50S ribosomal protein L29 [Bacillota bacterium]
MKAHELRDRTSEELFDELKVLKSELFKLRFLAATNQLENPIKLRLLKKDIARIKTVMREIELKGEDHVD